jgi:hypothetical protein
MMDDPIFKDGFYVYSNGMMIPESSAIEGASVESYMLDFEPKKTEPGEDFPGPSL